MVSEAGNQHPSGGTVRAFTVHDGPTHVDGDVRLHRQYFTYETDLGLVAGSLLSVLFTLKRPANEVWPHFKDWNRWQNLSSYTYSGVIGDLEGQQFFLTLDPSKKGYRYDVVRVVPERLIVINQPVPELDEEVSVPGLGVVSPGVHVFMLDERDGTTVVTGLMQHASLMADGSEAKQLTPKDALAPWSEMGVAGVRRWAEDFIPKLKELVEDGA